MAIGISTASQNAAVNAIATLADTDVGPGSIVLRTGAAPATANDAATGTLLVTIPLNDPAFAAGVSGVATLDVTPVPTAAGVAAGNAGYFRLLDNSGDVVLQGSVTVTGGGGDLEVNTLAVGIGTTVEITSGTLTMPAA